MMKRFFDIDWDRLNLLLLPTFLRKPLLFAFLKATTAPIWTIYKRFAAQRNETLFLLRYDTSKRNVETVLNRKFETTGIYIINNNSQDNGVYIMDVENEMIYLPVFTREPGLDIPVIIIFIKDEGEDATYLNFYIDVQEHTPDFTIMVPSEVHSAHIAEIEQYAALFTLPGFIFNVQPYRPSTNN